MARYWKQALFLVVAGGVILAIHIGVILFLTKTRLASLGSDFTIADLGAYGDSIAPLTASLALLAATFSALAYKAQRDTLEHERETSRMLRFDQLFFRAVDEYDAAIKRLRRTTPPFLPVETPAGGSRRSRTGSLLRELVSSWSGGAAHPSHSRSFWKDKFREPRYYPVHRYIRAFYAIIAWLDAVSDKNDKKRWMVLFRARMSGVEQKLIKILLQYHAPIDVRCAALRLGLFLSSELPPPDPTLDK